MFKNQRSPAHRRIDSLIETIQQHPTNVLEAERHLLSVKWFDYRFLSPRHANRIFVRTFQDIYRRKTAENTDRALASRVSGVNALTLKTNTRLRSQLNLARQRADALGIAYPIYVEAAFDFALRRSNCRKALQLPNQLLGNSKSTVALKLFITQRWQELLSDGLVRVEDPAYLIENYRSLPAQDQFRQFVLDQVKTNNVPLHRAIRVFTYDRRQLPAELFKSIASEEMYERSMEVVTDDLRIFPAQEDTPKPITMAQLWPTCFGMNYAREPSSAECSSCPFNGDCKKVGDYVLKKAALEVGVSDPAGDYNKRLGRNRQKKCRSRKREKSVLDLSIRAPTPSLCLSHSRRS